MGFLFLWIWFPSNYTILTNNTELLQKSLSLEYPIILKLSILESQLTLSFLIEKGESMKKKFRIRHFNIATLLCAGLISVSCGKDSLQEKMEKLEGKLKSLQSQISHMKKHPQSSGVGGNSIAQVVEEVVPKVVSIHAEKIIEVQPHQYFNPYEDFFFGNPRQQKPKSQKRKQQGLGSGVIFSKEGHILSNHHVAGDADKLMVTLSDGREFEAELVGSDKLSDVAVIKIKKPPKDLPVISLGNSDELRVGERVIAVGNPFGYSNTVTSGILSAKGRQVGINSYENYLQTDASSNPGNSGGALVNLKGELIGINTAIASRSGASNGIGFAIPINMAQSMLSELMEGGSVTRGYLGVYLQDVDKNLSEALGIKKTQGALITKVIEDSPAEKGGIEERDFIIEVDGKKIKNVNHLRNIVAQLKPKKTYKFKVIRNNKKKTLKVAVGVRDGEDLAQGKHKKVETNLGLALENINQNHIYRFNLNRKSGVIVMGVEGGSKSEDAGLRPGDIILSVDKEKIKSIRDFKNAIRKSKKKSVLVLVDRQGSTQFLGLKIK